MPTLTGLKIVAQSLSQSSRTTVFDRPPVKIKIGARSKVLSSKIHEKNKRSKSYNVFVAMFSNDGSARE